MKWSIGITTAPRERPCLRETQLSIEAAGFELSRAFIFAEPGYQRYDVEASIGVIENPRRLGAWQNFLSALKSLAATDADCILQCQDDIELTRDLRPWLESQLPSLDGLLALYCQAKNSAEKGWHKLASWHRGYGALAYVFRPELLRRFLAETELESGAMVDLRTTRWCFDQGVPVWLHTPSLCRHTGATSSLYSGVKTISENRQCGQFAVSVEQFSVK